MRKSAGFTLLELLVVVAILAIVSSLVMFNQQSIQQSSEQQLQQVQLTDYAKAVQRYYMHTQSFPVVSERGHPLDWQFLLTKPDSVNAWQPDYQLGWDGPYLKAHKLRSVSMHQRVLASGALNHDAAALLPAAINNYRAPADLFVQRPAMLAADWSRPCPVFEVDNPQAESGNSAACVGQWSVTNANGSQVLNKHPRPLWLFVFNGAQRVMSRIVSSGPNGRYESQAMAQLDACPPYIESGHPYGDDQWVCIF